MAPTPGDEDEATVLAARAALDLPRLHSVKYLLDWLIEGGYADDDEDVMHLNAVAEWVDRFPPARSNQWVKSLG